MLLAASGRKLFLPFYHTISNLPLPHIQHLYKVKTITEFEKELDFMLRYFRPISVNELTAYVKNRQTITQNSLVLSFDDGLKEMYEVVYPILKRKGIPAIFFLNTAFIDNRDLFFRYKASLIIDKILNSDKDAYQILTEASGIKFKHNADAILQILSIDYKNRHLLDSMAEKLGLSFKKFLESERPYLETSQIKEMADNGFYFGAHSIDHPYFHEITPDEQLFQATESLRYIREHFGERHSFFSFPFYDTLVKRSFYEKLYGDDHNEKPSLIFGSAGLKNDEFPFVQHRLCMEHDENGIRLLHSEYFRYLIKAILHKNIRKHPY